MSTQSWEDPRSSTDEAGWKSLLQSRVPEHKRKARMRGFRWLALPAVLAYLVFAILLQDALAITVNALSVSLLLASFYVDRKLGKDYLAACIMLAAGGIILIGGSLSDGHLESFALWLYPLIAMGTGFILGVRESLIATAIGALAILGTAYLHVHHPLDSVYPKSMLEAMFLRSVALVVASGFGLVVSQSNAEDINDQRAHTKALERAKVAVEQSDRVKSAFLAQASHEIRTPMNGILGMIQYLKSCPGLNQEAMSHIQSIETCSESLLTILRDVLDISRVESGDWSLSFAPLELVGLLHEVSTLFRTKTVGRGQELKFSTNAKEVWIMSDATRLRQVVSNLLGNAVKFCEQGEIEISLFAALSKRGTGQSVDLEIAIKDQGIGMPPEKLGALFQEFEQVRNPEGKSFGGTGLGLAISRQIIQKLGGNIEVQSQLGQGSTFTVALPAKLCAAQVKTRASTLTLPLPKEKALVGQKLKVLMVDDLPLNRRVCELALKRLKCDATHAEDGAQAVELAQEARFDLILMDLRMPVMGGIEAASLIVSNPGPNQHTPIIALTASAYDEDKLACLQAGMVDHLAKPFRVERLAELIDQHVRNAAPHAAIQPSVLASGGDS